MFGTIPTHSKILATALLFWSILIMFFCFPLLALLMDRNERPIYEVTIASRSMYNSHTHIQTGITALQTRFNFLFFS